MGIYYKESLGYRIEDGTCLSSTMMAHILIDMLYDDELFARMYTAGISFPYIDRELNRHIRIYTE